MPAWMMRFTQAQREEQKKDGLTSPNESSKRCWLWGTGSFRRFVLPKKTGAPRSLLGRRLIIPQTIRRSGTSISNGCFHVLAVSKRSVSTARRDIESAGLQSLRKTAARPTRYWHTWKSHYSTQNNRAESRTPSRKRRAIHGRCVWTTPAASSKRPGKNSRFLASSHTGLREDSGMNRPGVFGH